MNCCRNLCSLLIIGLILLATKPAAAQKAPELGYVFPPAIPSGTTTRAQFGGFDFTPDMQFLVHDQRLTLEVSGPLGEFLLPKPPYWFGEKGSSSAFPIAREVPARITIPAGFPEGIVHWQVANANGSSPTAVFYVSSTPEILEDRYREDPQMLAQFPVGVSGRLERITEVDRYQFVASRDGPYTVELFARRLGTDLNGIMEIRDSGGQMVADVADTEGVDAALTFAGKAKETYTVSLYDVDFRGNPAYVYRLAFNAGPRIVAATPAAGRRGETREVTFVGYGVASGKAELETTTRTVAFPADPRQKSFRYRLETPFGNSPPFELPLTDLPQRTERELDGAANKSPPVAGIAGIAGIAGESLLLATPASVTAHLSDKKSDAYSWDATKGDFYRLAARSRALGTNLDLAVQVFDPEGKMVASNDDLPGTTDTQVDVPITADGRYTCIVRDWSGRSGSLDSLYQLTVSPLEPSVELSVPQQIAVPIGGSAQLQVKAARFGGHQKEIAIEVQGLPPGVTVANDLKVPAGKNDLKISVEASDDAAATSEFITVVGRSLSTDQQTAPVVPAMAPLAGNLCSQDPAADRTSQVLLTTTLAPRYSLHLIDKNRQRAVHRGTTYPAPFTIEREEGFEGVVQLSMAARQGRHRQGIHGPIVTVPPDQDQASYPCFLPEWLETDRTTRMVILGMAQQSDPQGNVRHITSSADGRVTMILEGALLKVAHDAPELTVAAGDAFSIPIEISRSAKLSEPVSVALVVPEELAGLVTIESPVRLPVHETNAVLRIRTEPEARLIGRWELQIKATALQDGILPVVSQTECSVEFVDRLDE